MALGLPERPGLDARRRSPRNTGSKTAPENREKIRQAQKDKKDRSVMQELWKESDKIVKREMTGFVWVLYGRKTDASGSMRQR